KERLFKTGDFARWLANGTIDFLGRIDNQVKIRGYRVEIAEVENAFAKLQGITAARIIADKTSAETRLIAFYEGTLSVEALHTLLPSYMIPSLLVQVEKFPLTANGKIDDKELLNSIVSKEETPFNFSGNEAIIANIWQQIIGVAPSNPNQTFFELGGHSIKVMQLTHAIEKQTGTRISLRDVYNHSSLAGMAALLDNEPTDGLSVLLNNSTAGELMYLIPPIGGSATIYADLSTQLAPSFKCIGLQYPGLDDSQNFANSIEETALQFHNEIIKTAEQDISLLGYSLGALVAFETAKLLEASGKTITLILLDRNPAITTHKDMPEEIMHEIANKEMANWQSQPEKMKALVLQNLRNLQAYKQSGCIAGNILALNASQGNQSMMGWKNFTKGSFHLNTLDAHHYSMLANKQLTQHLLKLNF
ncbi:MAG TPA: thioesterase domain-containing protein, partial [Ferruginibacter sp.]|nr:thioesterase domain-containing protein [Ferruginibacter sp.]